MRHLIEATLCFLSKEADYLYPPCLRELRTVAKLGILGHRLPIALRNLADVACRFWLGLKYYYFRSPIGTILFILRFKEVIRKRRPTW